MPHLARVLPTSFIVLALLGTVLLTGCATSYKSIRPETLMYSGEQTSGPLTFSYRYNALEEARNGRYAKKANNRGISTVAVRVVNNGDTAASLDLSTLDVTTGQRRLGFVDPGTVASVTKQPVLPHLLWGLLTFTIQDGDDITVFPIGVPIAIGNMVVAGSANGKAQRQFREQHLLNRTVQPGETAYGLLFIQDAVYAPLTFEYSGPGSEQPSGDGL